MFFRTSQKSQSSRGKQCLIRKWEINQFMKKQKSGEILWIWGTGQNWGITFLYKLFAIRMSLSESFLSLSEKRWYIFYYFWMCVSFFFYFKFCFQPYWNFVQLPVLNSVLWSALIVLLQFGIRVSFSKRGKSDLKYVVDELRRKMSKVLHLPSIIAISHRKWNRKRKTDWWSISVECISWLFRFIMLSCDLNLEIKHLSALWYEVHFETFNSSV